MHIIHIPAIKYCIVAQQCVCTIITLPLCSFVSSLHSVINQSLINWKYIT